MSDHPSNSCVPAPEVSAAALAAFQRHAFTALLDARDRPPKLADVAETASRDALDVAHAVAWLDTHGQLEHDGEHLVGAHGLTRRTTPHALTIGGRTMHTWCAYDAIAIPVALGVTARAETTCPICHRPLAVDIDTGQVPDTPAPVLWIPTGPCQHVIDDFCTRANLFCTPDHLDTWRHAAGDPPGRPTMLAEVPALARNDWGDIAHHP